MLGLVGRLGRKATITKTPIFQVSNKVTKFDDFLNSVDWDNTEISEVQYQLEQASQAYQQGKTVKRTAALIDNGKAAEATVGKSLKNKYIKRFGDYIATELPKYLRYQTGERKPDPTILNSIGQSAFDFLDQVGADDKKQLVLAYHLAKVALSETFDRVYNNSQLVGDDEDTEVGPESIIECGCLLTATAKGIGQRIELIAKLSAYKQQDPSFFWKAYRKYLKDPIFGDDFANKCVDIDAVTNDLVWEPWSARAVVKVGLFFLTKLYTVPLAFTKDESNKSVKVPLFASQLVRFSAKETQAYVIPGPVLVNNAAVVAAVAKENAFFKPPLLVEPVPHSNEAVGGYHTEAALGVTPLVRKVFHKHPIVIGDKPIAAVNKLQSVAYTVNTFVLDNLDAIKAELVTRANVSRELNPEKYVVPGIGHYLPYVRGVSRRHVRKTYRTETVVAVANKFAGKPFWHAWS